MRTVVAQNSPQEFAQLVEELGELEQDRGYAIDVVAQARRVAIEQRLMFLLCAEVAADERRGSIRVPTNLSVQVKTERGASAGKLTNVGVGGAFIEVGVPAQVGDEVVVLVERGRDSFEHTFQLRGRVAWLSAADGRRVAGFGVAFARTSDTEDRRLRRLVLDLLRAHASRG
jgi:Tfp pilus assembly protein PilZ